MLGVSDVPRAAAFWMEALGYVPREAMEDDWVVLVPADGAGVQLALGLSETPVHEHPRIHLDLYAGDAVDQAAEVERLVSLGALRVDWDLYPDDADLTTTLSNVLGLQRRDQLQKACESCRLIGSVRLE